MQEHIPHQFCRLQSYAQPALLLSPFNLARYYISQSSFIHIFQCHVCLFSGTSHSAFSCIIILLLCLSLFRYIAQYYESSIQQDIRDWWAVYCGIYMGLHIIHWLFTIVSVKFLCRKCCVNCALWHLHGMHIIHGLFTIVRVLLRENVIIDSVSCMLNTSVCSQTAS